MNTETMVRRILRTYDAATDAERDDGHTWYLSAHSFSHDLASRYPVAYWQAAGILAALSPQTSWDLNVRNAETLLATGTAPTLGLSVRKAVAVLAGHNPDQVFAPPPKRPLHYGAKVRAFYACIRDPLTTNAVCLDRHAYAIAAGTPAGNPKALERVGEYARVAHAYRVAARRRGIRPHEMQAVTWLVWRRTHAPGWADRDPVFGTDLTPLDSSTTLPL